VNHSAITASSRLMGPEPKAAFFDECRFHMRMIVQRALCSFGIEPKGDNHQIWIIRQHLPRYVLACADDRKFIHIICLL
jgi:hypothetical protein